MSGFISMLRKQLQKINHDQMYDIHIGPNEKFTGYIQEWNDTALILKSEHGECLLDLEMVRCITPSKNNVSKVALPQERTGNDIYLQVEAQKELLEEPQEEPQKEQQKVLLREAENPDKIIEKINIENVRRENVELPSEIKEFLLEVKSIRRYFRFEMPEFDIKIFRDEIPENKKEVVLQILGKVNDQVLLAKKNKEINRYLNIKQLLCDGIKQSGYVKALLYNLMVCHINLTVYNEALDLAVILARKHDVSEAYLWMAYIYHENGDFKSVFASLGEFFEKNMPCENTELFKFYCGLLVEERSYSVVFDLFEKINPSKQTKEFGFLCFLLSASYANEEKNFEALKYYDFYSKGELTSPVLSNILRIRDSLCIAEIERCWTDFKGTLKKELSLKIENGVTSFKNQDKEKSSIGNFSEPFKEYQSSSFRTKNRNHPPVGDYYGMRFYKRAQKAYSEKKYPESIKLYREAISKNDNYESAVKDLGRLLQEIGRNAEAISLLESHINKMKDKVSVYNQLDNHYIYDKNFARSLEILEILSGMDVDFNKIQRRKAFALTQLKEFDKAEKVLNSLLKRYPFDKSLEAMLSAVKKARETGDLSGVDAVFCLGIQEFRKTGMSPILEESLNKCEFEGVPLKVIANKDFTVETIFSIDLLIERVRSRPREKASFLLTKARLLKEVDGAYDALKFNFTLARYCMAMASTVALESGQMDVVRCFYLEAFVLDVDLAQMKRSIALYLASYIFSGNDFVAMEAKELEIKKIINQIFASTEISKDYTVWYGLIDLFLVSTKVTEYLLQELFANKKALSQSAVFFREFGISAQSDSLSAFASNWESVRKWKIKKDDERSAKIRLLGSKNSLLAISADWEVVIRDIKKDWLPGLDRQRLDNLLDIGSLWLALSGNLVFEEKLRCFEQLEERLKQILRDIDVMPTRFSVLDLSPLLKNGLKIINDEKLRFLESNYPEPSLSLLGTERIYDIDGFVVLQVKVSNSKNCAPMLNPKICVEDETGLYRTEELLKCGSVSGGETVPCTLKMTLPQEAIQQGAVSLKITCIYNLRWDKEELKKQETETLKLYSENDFCLIYNPYSPLAEGGPVDSEQMFFGRSDLLRRLSDSLMGENTKCVLLYGQKRSGKSSVLLHLKRSLENMGQAVCAKFSMGDIIDGISAAKFLFKIAEQIWDSIVELVEDSPEIGKPDIEEPFYQDFKEEPVLTFDAWMKKLKRSCSILPEWQKRRFVIMVDEFTYLYTAIVQNKISSDFMKTWKALVEKRYFSAVLVGQDVMPKFKKDYQNEFGVTEDIRLTYLDESGARDLVEKPVYDNENKRSRYVGRAVELIIDITAGSPYYLQMFCARLIDYMNRTKSIFASEADVEKIAGEMCEGHQSLGEDKFDNLFSAGDADVSPISAKDSRNILTQIAFEIANHHYCEPTSIFLDDKEKTDFAIKDLLTRNVIDVKDEKIRIIVDLLRRWLLKHRDY